METRQRNRGQSEGGECKERGREGADLFMAPSPAFRCCSWCCWKSQHPALHYVHAFPETHLAHICSTMFYTRVDTTSRLFPSVSPSLALLPDAFLPAPPRTSPHLQRQCAHPHVPLTCGSNVAMGAVDVVEATKSIHSTHHTLHRMSHKTPTRRHQPQGFRPAHQNPAVMHLRPGSTGGTP